jgi:hypothetical protein
VQAEPRNAGWWQPLIEQLAESALEFRSMSLRAVH